MEPPDFTDCSLTTPEADLDWYSVIHQGGPARGFDRMMPAFGDELSEDEIARVIAHIRGFCKERGWPHGDLNMPRALVTEKAYPENEAVLTTTFARGDTRNVRSEFPACSVALGEARDERGLLTAVLGYVQLQRLRAGRAKRLARSLVQRATLGRG